MQLSIIPDIVGILGVITVLLAYYLLNTNRIQPTHIMYLLMNFIGAGLILFSLFFAWNLSAAIIEIAWILISLIGIYRYIKSRARNK